MITETVIKIENLYKEYRLGVIGHGTLYRDIQSRWARLRGKEDPNSIIGRSNNGGLTGKNERVLVLKNINFEVNRGEIIGIIGKNGAGKSTLLKIISRITAPTKGSVKAKGRIGSLLEVGTGFHPELTGLENIYLNGAILGMSKAEIRAKVDDIMDFSGVSAYIDTPVKRYSSGMVVRLAFAVAAHLDPEILLIDEVLAVGDADFQKKCLGKMKSVTESGRTILFVSHNMLAIKKLCNKSILLDKGNLICLDDTSRVVERYLNSEEKLDGEVFWNSPESAPGDHRVRLKAIRVVSGGHLTGTPDHDKDIEIQTDYWNLEKGGKRLLSMHVINSMEYTLITSGNLEHMTLTPDPWASKEYPIGLYRTTCTIPKNLLNIGRHSLNLFIRGENIHDKIIRKNSILSFDVRESEQNRRSYFGEWVGAIRPRLDWKTIKIE